MIDLLYIDTIRKNINAIEQGHKYCKLLINDKTNDFVCELMIVSLNVTTKITFLDKNNFFNLDILNGIKIQLTMYTVTDVYLTKTLF